VRRKLFGVRLIVTLTPVAPTCTELGVMEAALRASGVRPERTAELWDPLTVKVTAVASTVEMPVMGVLEFGLLKLATVIVIFVTLDVTVKVIVTVWVPMLHVATDTPAVSYIEE
jgi:hypothetical protein